jgi:hypothetical protein
MSVGFLMTTYSITKIPSIRVSTTSCVWKLFPEHWLSEKWPPAKGFTHNCYLLLLERVTSLPSLVFTPVKIYVKNSNICWCRNGYTFVTPLLKYYWSSSIYGISKSIRSFYISSTSMLPGWLHFGIPFISCYFPSWSPTVFSFMISAVLFEE